MKGCAICAVVVWAVAFIWAVVVTGWGIAVGLCAVAAALAGSGVIVGYRDASRP